MKRSVKSFNKETSNDSRMMMRIRRRRRRRRTTTTTSSVVESSWNVMAHSDAREGKWWGNWRMEWETSTLYTTSEHGVSSITTADAHTSAASRRLNWRPRRFKWTRPFRRKTKSGFCACAITFQTQSTNRSNMIVGSELLRDSGGIPWQWISFV